MDVSVRLPKIFEGDPKKIIGAKITDVLRRAKIVIIKLDNELNIVVHLKMTGQLVYGEARTDQGNRGTTGGQGNQIIAETISFSQGIPFAGFSLPAKTTHVIFELSGGVLFFNDMRQFGWIRIMSNEQLAIINEKYGPEPFSKDFTVEHLKKILANWGRPVKLLLLEQSKIAGIGNIYANEALWCAEISPMHRGRDLVKDHPEKIAQLYECIKKVLEMGLKYGGSSAADEAFVNAEGKPGKMQEHFVVYQKNGQMCPRCGGEIKVSRIGGRGTFFCPKCQK